MPGTIRKIIDRIKDVRSGGDSVVALTIETRLVLQGFDPQRFDYNDADDAARLARLQEIAAELGVDISDLIADADVAPDPEAEPGPMPRPPVRSAAAAGGEPVSSVVPGQGNLPAGAAAGAAGAQTAAAVAAGPDDDHPLHQFSDLVDETLDGLSAPPAAGEITGAPFAVLIKASLLMALYSVPSDRELCQAIGDDATYRWFLGLGRGEGNYDADAFGVDRENALDSEVGRRVLRGVVQRAGRLGLFRSQRLKVNGPLLKSWIS